MKYAVEMCSGAMIYISSFTKIGSGIQKFMGGGIHRHTQHGDRISLLSFSQNKESMLKMNIKICGGRVWTGFIWLRIRTSGGLLCSMKGGESVK
jgi:hypothetical protein